MDLFSMEPMRYYSPAASTDISVKKQHLDQMIRNHSGLWSEKIDGNWSRAIITDTRAALQTRGISKKTGEYGEIQDKVFFWNDVVKAFSGRGTTIILGEVFMDGAIDRQIGAVLRCLPDKALSRQKEQKLHWYVFDVLYFDGIELMNCPIEERIKYIPKVVERVNSPLVVGANYYEMKEDFYDKMEELFAKGKEGAVCYKKDAIYIPGKRGPKAWDSIKVKQEIGSDIDCFITGLVPCEKSYQGHDLASWELWRNTRSGELIHGLYYGEYQLGGPYEPVSRNFFNGYCGAITVSVYDNNGNIVPLCNVAGLTDDMKASLRDNYDEWYMCPLTIGGMMVSTANSNSISIRHPYLKSIRKEDIDIKDCTLSKILSQN